MARQIVVDIIGDPSKFNKSIDSVTKKTDGLAGSLGGVATKVVAGGALMVGAIGAAGVAIFGFGSQAEAMSAKAKTVFGSALGTVEKWADKSAHAMGLSKKEAIGLAAGFGDLLIPMGFTREQAAKMSTDVVGLSGALSEWSGGTKSAAEVSDILSKAMLGERDGLKALGISISEADVQQQLLKDGTDKLTGAALEQAKAVATQELIFQKSQDAQDAYAKGTAEGIRTQHEMEAQLKEVGDTLISTLYPIVLKVAKFMAENLPKAIQFAKDAWRELGPTILTVAGFIGDVAKVVIPILVTVIGKLVDIFKTVWPIISGAVGTAVGIIKTAVQNVQNYFGATGKAVDTLKTNLTNAWNNIVNFIRGIPGRIANALGNMFDPLWKGFKGVINAIIRGWNNLSFSTGPFVAFGITHSGINVNTPNLPYLHAGGIVPGRPGSNVPAMLQAGEQVIARKDVGRGGLTVIVQGNVYGVDDLMDIIAHRLRLEGA